jgi:predicted nuclease of predicted toxin-antitoxin system
MRIKLDENLPESWIADLAGFGHDVDNVRMEGLAGRNDPDVWRSAQTSGRFLITQDLDFSDIRKFAPGTHEGLLLLRLRAPGRLALAKRLTELFRTESVESWSRCFVLVSDRKLRIRRPAA